MYTQITYDQFVAAISARLNDPTNRFWRLAEVQGYALESLQTYQAFSAFTSVQQSLTTTTANLYDLTAELTDLQPSTTDQALIIQIQRHLQEPESATSWIGSEQFTYTQVVNAIQKRLDKFLIETGLGQKISTQSITAGNGTEEMANEVIDVVRALWEDLSGSFTLLFKTDQFALTAVEPTWFTAPGTPTDFTVVLNTPLMIQLAPPPAANGTLHLITVNSGPTLNPASSPTILPIPDDLAWVVKFGALADLFGQDGPGKDVDRADYCESRWKEGCALGRIYNAVRFGYQNGAPAFVDSLADLDAFYPNWMNSAAGPTQNIAVSGTVLAVNPPPTSGLTITFDIMPKMPLPAAGGDFIQVGKEVVDALIDYAQHLAMVKEGIVELTATQDQYKNLVRIAAITNDRLRANNEDFDALSDRSLRQYHEDPRRKSDISKSELDYQQDAV